MTTEEICEKYGIKNYTINPDGSIDVNGRVDLSDKGLVEIPILFNRVSRDFDCGFNKLTSLKGSPRWIGGNFECDHNRLTSLEFSPDYVGSGFFCGNNDLTDLVGSPKEVGGEFDCISNKLYNPKGCSEKIGKRLICSYTPLSSIFDKVDRHFLYSFNFYKIIKDDTVNLKRLRYVMDLYDHPIYLEKIQKHYRIV